MSGRMIFESAFTPDNARRWQRHRLPSCRAAQLVATAAAAQLVRWRPGLHAELASRGTSPLAEAAR